MKLTQLKFKQVAKRYATAKELPLATAQEELATFFGFRNLDAALKALPESSKEHTVGSDGSTQEATKADSPVLWCGLSFNEFRLLAHFLEKKAVAEYPSDAGLWLQKSKDLFDAVTLALPLMVDTNQSPITLKRALTVQNIERLYLEAVRGVVDGVWPLATAKLARVIEGMPGYDIKRFSMTGELDQLTKGDLVYRCSYMERVYLDPLQAIEMTGGAERVKLWTGDRSDLWYLLSDFLKVIAGQKRIPTGTEYKSFNTCMTLGDQASIYGTPPEADPATLTTKRGYTPEESPKRHRE